MFLLQSSLSLDVSVFHSSSGTVYRVWDISSKVLYRSKSRYRNDLVELFKHIAASCILWMTSPVFLYQIEKEEDEWMESTSMTKSMQYFGTLFEAESKIEAESKEIEKGEILGTARSAWPYTPIITVFTKCDLFRMDMDCAWDESKTVLLSFPEYDGPQSYEAIIAYLKAMFRSLNVSRKRPFHIYEAIAIDEDAVKKIVGHIQSVTNLHTVNKRLQSQNSTPQIASVSNVKMMQQLL